MTKQQQIDDPESTWNTTAPDEPVFILRARDRLAPRTVQRWIEAAERSGVDVDLRALADLIRLQILQWQIEHGATGLSLEPIVKLPEPDAPHESRVAAFQGLIRERMETTRTNRPRTQTPYETQMRLDGAMTTFRAAVLRDDTIATDQLAIDVAALLLRGLIDTGSVALTAPPIR